MFSFVALLTLTIVLVSWKKMYQDGAAVHASGTNCYFVINNNPSDPLNPGANLMILAKGTYKYTETPSGNATLVCKANLLEGQEVDLSSFVPTDGARHVSSEEWNIPCVIQGVTNGATDTWNAVITPSGQAITVCHWKKK